MKKYVIWLLVLCAGFSLPAQTRNPALSVFVAPVTGTGNDPGDNAFFASQLAIELLSRNYSVMGDLSEAKYSLNGELSPWAGDAPLPNTRAALYSFRLILSESASGIELAEQTLVYASREELNNLLSVMVSEIFSELQREYNDNRAWRNKQWYFGLTGFWSPRIYIGTSQSANITNFSGSVQAEFHPLDLLSLETGIGITPDWVAITSRNKDNYRDLIMEIPLTAKLVLKPGNYFMIEPYAGLNLNIPLLGVTKPPVLSWRIGLQYGIKAGPGIFFVEPLFSIDTAKSTLTTPFGQIQYQRYTIYIGAGYKYGIGEK